MRQGSTVRAFAAVLLALMPAMAKAQALAPHEELAKDLYRELIGIRTVHPDGDNTAAAKAAARRLIEAGFDAGDVEIFEPAPRKGNLVARLRGTGELEPMLLLAHIDVVEARKEDWSDGLDPFVLTERQGYFYGRGTIDDKAQAAIFVANLIRAKREGWRPRRDVIVALTADEEGGSHNGVAWLLANRRGKIAAQFAINEGGNLRTREGVPAVHAVQVSEKIPVSFEFVAKNAGGHSSLPRADNAIYDLAAALDRLGRLEFAARVGYVARMFAAKAVEGTKGEMAGALVALARGDATADEIRVVTADPGFNAQLRTTCVATRVEAGHADNALAQSARAVVNCRLLPGESEEHVQAELARVAGERVAVRPLYRGAASDASDPESRVMRTIARVSESMWPGVPVVPVMSAGATDGSRLRNAGIPVYGVAGLAMDGYRMHGRDERIAVRAFFEGAEFLYRLMKSLGAGE